MLIAFNKDLLEGKQAVCNLLHWESAKLSRTVNSTLAAETQSLARGIGDLLWMVVMYHEMVNPGFQVREWRKCVNQTGYTAFAKNEEENLADALSANGFRCSSAEGGAERNERQNSLGRALQYGGRLLDQTVR